MHPNRRTISNGFSGRGGRGGRGALFDYGKEGEWDAMGVSAPMVVNIKGNMRMYYQATSDPNTPVSVGACPATPPAATASRTTTRRGAERSNLGTLSVGYADIRGRGVQPL